MKVLIACSGDKLREVAPARHLYQGRQFRMRWTWGRLLHGGVAGILSTKYGLVMPDQVIEHYDLTHKQLNAAQRVEWAARVRRQIMHAFPSGSRLVVLAGRAYVEGWVNSIPRRSVQWRRFGGIGYERQALAREIARARADGTNKR